MRVRRTSSVILAVAACIACFLPVACNTGEDTDKATFTATAQSGIERCVRACETFQTTGCGTRAADFCASAQANCEGRYRDHASCVAELGFLDNCAAGQIAANFSCPLGSIRDEIRPYRLSEDACVDEAMAVRHCL